MAFTSSLKRKLLLSCLALLPLAASAAVAPLSPLDKAWSKIETPEPNLGSRAIMEFILEAAGSPENQKHGTRIEAAFRCLERMQDRDPASKTYGNFCWYWHEQKPGDLNAVEFVTQHATLLKLRYANHLSPKAGESLDRLLTLAVEGMHRQKVDVGYTNIYLMKTWNLLALGEGMKRPELVQEGAAMLDQWIDFTGKNGIREFLSPTYYGVDLDSLGLMARQLSNPTVQEKAKRCLLLFWTNIAANWFEPARRLGGAHGRDYDYLTGHGVLDLHLLDAGWIDASQCKPPVFPVIAEATRWLPPENIHRAALTTLPRFVFQKWDAPDTAWSSQYVGHHVSLGVSGCSQGPEDKPFALTLDGPAGAKTVMVNFFMDGRGDPYGKNKIPTGASGHKKSHHLVPFLGAVQSGADVLFLASWPIHGRPVSKKEPVPVCLLSHLNLPVEAVVWTADKPVDAGAASQPLPDNLCFLRMGDVAVGLHFLLALDTAGKPAPVQLFNDGAPYAAKRLTVTHSSGPPGEGQGLTALAIRVAEGLDDAGFAAFRRDFIQTKTSAAVEKGVVHVTAGTGKRTLTLDADLTASRILHSQGFDNAMQTAPMSVNGKDYCTGLLRGDSRVGF